MNNYFIKNGYINNPVKTLNESDIIDNYWTEKRIAESALFQYHVYEYASKIFIKNKYKTIADIGSGPGWKTINLFEGIAEKIYLMDQPTTESKVVKKSNKILFKSVNLEEVETLDLKLKFDLIVCADVIEHLDNPNFLLDFIKRHLSESGKAIISTPERDNRRGLSNLKSPNLEHVREWNKSEFYKYIESQNFKVLEHFTLPMKKVIGLSKFFYKKSKKIKFNETQLILIEKK